jgi:hypothetical protein
MLLLAEIPGRNVWEVIYLGLALRREEVALASPYSNTLSILHRTWRLVRARRRSAQHSSTAALQGREVCRSWPSSCSSCDLPDAS